MDSLEGRVALVTGASRGIGRAIALRLSALGARVAINYLTSDEQARSIAGEIEGKSREAMLVRADVADATAVRAMTREVARRWGRIDILVNNAGIVKDNLLLRMPDEAWDEVMNTNLRAS